MLDVYGKLGNKYTMTTDDMGVRFPETCAFLLEKNRHLIISYAHEKSGGFLGLNLTTEFLGVPRKSWKGLSVVDGAVDRIPTTPRKIKILNLQMGVSKNRVSQNNGKTENPIKIRDLGIKFFLETPKSPN